MKVLMNDFSIYGNKFDKCLTNFSKVLQKSKEVN